MYLLIDFMNPQGSRAFTSNLDKIKRNLDLIKPLKSLLEQHKQTRKGAFSIVTVFGRWLVVYSADVTNDEEEIMHFIDFRVDLTDDAGQGLFSDNTLRNMIELQTRYDSAFSDKMDTIELTFAELYEIVGTGGIIMCDNNDIVIAKAKVLGVFPMIEHLHGNDKVKVSLADEKVTIDNKIITNIYAVIHFGGHSDESDNGFAYLKLYDLLNNFDKIDAFQKGIEEAGGKFDRAFFMERFDKHKLN